MAIAQPTRRSRRREKHTFTAGDKVEVVRTEGFEIGTLLRKIEDNDEDSPSGTGASIRWKVAFHHGDSEEEISEKYMGRLVESSNESESSSTNKKSLAKRVSKAKNNGRLATAVKGSSSDHDENGETVIKVKMLTGTLYLYRGMNPRAEFVRTV